MLKTALKISIRNGARDNRNNYTVNICDESVSMAKMLMVVNSYSNKYKVNSTGINTYTHTHQYLTDIVIESKV